MFKIIVCIFLSTLVACGGDQNDTHKVERSKKILEAIEKNKLLWNSLGIKNYSFVYSGMPADCPTAGVMPPVEIAVSNGVVLSVYVPAWNRYESSPSLWPTIDDVFDDMVELAAEDLNTYSATAGNKNMLPEFDAVVGHPKAFYIDKTAKSCDATSTLLSDFQILYTFAALPDVDISVVNGAEELPAP